MKAFIGSIVLSVASLVVAQSIDNSAAASSLTAQAQTLPDGQYTITTSNGKGLVYSRTNGQAYAPTSGAPSSVALESVGGNTMRISMGNDKCISAQWSYSIGADWAGVLYACAIGSGPLTNGLVVAKQQWLFIPVSGGGGGSDDSTPAASVNASAAVGVAVQGAAKVAQLGEVQVASSAKTGGLSKVANVGDAKVANSAVVRNGMKPAGSSAKVAAKSSSGKSAHRHDSHRHDDHRHDDHRRDDHHDDKKSSRPSTCRSKRCRAAWDERQRELARLQTRRRRSSHHKRDEVAPLEKRAGNQYYIIALDHLHDMTTRALTNGVSLSGDGNNVPSWTLDVFQEGNSAQIFTVTPA